MVHIHNFSAGPAALPAEVLAKLSQAVIQLPDHNISICETGHRTAYFLDIKTKIDQNISKLFNIPATHTALLLHGGARNIFPHIGANCGSGKEHANYLITGYWSEQAATAAGIDIKRLTNQNPCAIDNNWQIDKPDLNNLPAYTHYCPNETISGLQFDYIPDNTKVPLIADMTSCLGMQTLDIKRFDMLYASCQKNLGIAGVCVVIINDKLLSRSAQNANNIPAIANYSVQKEHNSLYNTPNTLGWYTLLLMLEWMEQQGGIAQLAQRNKEYADKIYDLIDNSSIYTNNIAVANRSTINITFNLPSKEQEIEFLQQAESSGLVNLKGHKIAGGIRASIYNSTDDDKINSLIKFMQHFAQNRKF